MVVNKKNLINNISLIIDSLINMITNKDVSMENTNYYYHYEERQEFIVALYLLKLLVNKKDYLKNKHNEYLNKISKKINEKGSIKDFDISKITNIEVNNIFDLINSLKDLIIKEEFSYDKDTQKIIFDSSKWLDIKWLTAYISLILDNKKTKEVRKDITICYTIPDKNIQKLSDITEIDNFLEQFTYYNIKVKYTDKTKTIKENNILIIKNAAINYLKHLKQYKHGLESEESYLIFYNLLKNECYKQGFILKEETKLLSEVEDQYLDKVKERLNDELVDYRLSKQVHTIENIVWQLSNDITMLEHINMYFDSTIDFISLLYNKTSHMTYNKLKWTYNLHDIQILLILITLQFAINYLYCDEKIDYSLLDLSNIKPQYMNSICEDQEEDIKQKIHSIEVEINSYKKSIDKYKKERESINKNKLGADKYLKELERCVGNINRASINIGTLNSKIANLKREYEAIKKAQEERYMNADLYNYNHSIIKHICNSIISCSFYLKTNNNNKLFDNIIIFEDYIRSDNAFYLEISFKELLKISHPNIIVGIVEQNDLPKLAK